MRPIGLWGNGTGYSRRRVGQLMASRQDDGALDEERWIAINTHPHREHIALENLRRQQFEAYCPMLRKRRSHARRVELVLRPLFPNYLFVRANAQLARWRPILS